MAEGFLLYKSFYEPIQKLTDIQRGKLLTAIFEYQLFGREIDLPPDVQMAFLFIKNQFQVDTKKYQLAQQKTKIYAPRSFSKPFCYAHFQLLPKKERKNK